MANLSGVTKYFPTPSEGYSSTLSSTIVSGATVVPVASASQYDNGDVVVLIVDPKTSDEAVFTGTKTSLPDRFIDCVWTEGNVGVGHASGAVIADYVTATHLAMVTEGLLKSHNQDSTLKAGKIDWSTDPLWIPFDASPSGFSSISTSALYFKKIGSTVHIYATFSGTSNGILINFNLPYPTIYVVDFPCRITNNGVVKDNPGLIEIAGQGAAVYASFSGAGFTATGTKTLHPITFTYLTDV